MECMGSDMGITTSSREGDRITQGLIHAGGPTRKVQFILTAWHRYAS